MSDTNGRIRFLKSDSIAALAAALAKAQGEMASAKKDAENPYFKSRYADLASCWDACRGVLSKNGLAVMQFPREHDGGVEVETLLAHASGEWVSETLKLPVSKKDAQALGSAITYGRRYGLTSIVGIAPEDDDGNAATKSKQEQRPAAKPVEPEEPAITPQQQALAEDWKEWMKTVPNPSDFSVGFREHYLKLPDDDKAVVKPVVWEEVKRRGWKYDQASNGFISQQAQEVPF